MSTPDILVNNAGTIKRSPAVEHPEDWWDEVIETNLSAQFLLTQAVGRGMIARGRGGKVIFTASLLTFQAGITVPGYAASKGGVGQLTMAFANEWAAKGIQVNSIAPGYIATDNTQALRNDPDLSASILGRIPAGRWGTPEGFRGTRGVPGKPGVGLCLEHDSDGGRGLDGALIRRSDGLAAGKRGRD
ncbi:MAG: kduD [Rhodobacteraceae bacterium]|nr:MAG: kduD [Paracoccaceae bacterium]